MALDEPSAADRLADRFRIAIASKLGLLSNNSNSK
jgi:hypothetical protein